MVRAAAPGSLKNVGQVVRLGCCAALVDGYGLAGGWFIGSKYRGREEKDEESGGKSFHGNPLGKEGSRPVGKRKGRAVRPVTS